MPDFISYAPVLWCKRLNRRRRDSALKPIDVFPFITALRRALASSPSAATAWAKTTTFWFHSFHGLSHHHEFSGWPARYRDNPSSCTRREPELLNFVRCVPPWRWPSRNTMGKTRLLCPQGGHPAPTSPSTRDSWSVSWRLQ